MNGCHKCPHAADVAAGKYSGVPWEETPCAACALREYSVGTLPFDEERPAAGGREQSEACGTVAWSCTVAEGEEADPLLPLSVLAEFVRGLMQMTPATRDTVCLRYQGLKYREIAARQGGTVSAAETRHWRAMTRWPELKALFALKAAKRARKGKERG